MAAVVYDDYDPNFEAIENASEAHECGNQGCNDPQAMWDADSGNVVVFSRNKVPKTEWFCKECITKLDVKTKCSFCSALCLGNCFVFKGGLNICLLCIHNSLKSFDEDIVRLVPIDLDHLDICVVCRNAYDHPDCRTKETYLLRTYFNRLCLLKKMEMINAGDLRKQRLRARITRFLGKTLTEYDVQWLTVRIQEDDINLLIDSSIKTGLDFVIQMTKIGALRTEQELGFSAH